MLYLKEWKAVCVHRAVRVIERQRESRRSSVDTTQWPSQKLHRLLPRLVEISSSSESPFAWWASRSWAAFSEVLLGHTSTFLPRACACEPCFPGLRHDAWSMSGSRSTLIKPSQTLSSSACLSRLPSLPICLSLTLPFFGDGYTPPCGPAGKSEPCKAGVAGVKGLSRLRMPAGNSRTPSSSCRRGEDYTGKSCWDTKTRVI